MQDEGQNNGNFRCGTAAIVGRPNVGKSTLLNRIVGEKVAIVSPVPQTTRNQIRGIFNDERGQIVFIDTPGLHFGRDHLDRFMEQAAYGVANGADCVVYLVDANDAIGKEEESIARRLSTLTVPVIMGLNKIDEGDRRISDYISLWETVKAKPVNEVDNFILLPLSAKNGTNVEKLVTLILETLPLCPPLYPRDTVTDIPQKMAIADIIREKLFNVMREEIPHSIAVIIEDMRPIPKKTTHIRALVLVEKESQKMIVIGKDGKVLKQVGMQARQELEELLAGKVFLEIYVKDKRNWRDNYSLLEEMGYMYER